MVASSEIFHQQIQQTQNQTENNKTFNTTSRFIGPTSEVVRKMGDKTEARKMGECPLTSSEEGQEADLLLLIF